MVKPLRRLVDCGFSVVVLEITDLGDVTGTIMQPETEDDAAQSMVLGYLGLHALRDALSDFLDIADAAIEAEEVLQRSLDKDVA